MKIICKTCGGQFNISSGRAARAKTDPIYCSRCDHRIELQSEDLPHPDRGSGRKPPLAQSGLSGSGLSEEVFAEAYNAADKPFDFLADDERTALICEENPEMRLLIMNAIRKMGYHAAHALSAREALRQMRYHAFDLLAVNETFDCGTLKENQILRYLNRMPMGLRRDTFVALVSESCRTMDKLSAFSYSVDLVVNIGHLHSMVKILRKGLNDHRAFYDVLRDARASLGSR
jgi:CheY-like chemotaxis protein